MPPGLPMSDRANDPIRGGCSRQQIAGSVVFKLAICDPKADDGCTRVTPLALKRNRIAQQPLPEDREIVSALAGNCSIAVGATRVTTNRCLSPIWLRISWRG